MVEDTYRSIQAEAEGIYKDKGSKFLAFAYPVSNEQQIKTYLEKLRKKYHDARHHCYAYRIGFKEYQFRANDDGEPSGTAGKPILGQIIGKELTNILIIVVRYFGGVLLGTSGLIKAYRMAVVECLNNAAIIERTIDVDLKISFDYEQLSLVMKIIKEEKIEVVEQILENNCAMKLRMRQSFYPRIKARVMKISKLTIIEC